MKKRMGALSVAIAVTSVIATQAQVAPAPDALGDLSRAEAKWTTSKPRNYEFRIQLLCGLCPPLPPGREPHLFQVQNGVSTLSGNPNATERADLAKYGTVESQFSFIRHYVDQKPARAELAYDPQLGHPLRVYFDLNNNVTDDEFGFLVSAFKVLSEGKRALPNNALQPTGASVVPS